MPLVYPRFRSPAIPPCRPATPNTVGYRYRWTITGRSTMSSCGGPEPHGVNFADADMNRRECDYRTNEFVAGDSGISLATLGPTATLGAPRWRLDYGEIAYVGAPRESPFLSEESISVTLGLRVASRRYGPKRPLGYCFAESQWSHHSMIRVKYRVMPAVRTGETMTTGSVASNICPFPKNIATLWLPSWP